MEKGFYTQVVIIRRKNFDDIKERGKTKRFNSQGQSARMKHWFNLDHEWLKETSMTREPYFYK